MAIAKTGFLTLSVVSLIYAAVTAPRDGIDLAMIQELGRAWVDGVYQTAAGRFYGPPPFAWVLFSPLSLISLTLLRVIFVAVNLAATGLILVLVKKLWGAAWPAKAHLYLAALFLCWSAFRVTLRNGQISLIVTALVLGAFLAWKRGASALAGLLLGLSLCKYSLTLPFALYFVWRRAWTVAAVAILTVTALTEVFALRLGLSLFEVTGDYVRIMLHTSITNEAHFTGATEIGPLLFALTGNEQLATGLYIAVTVVAVLAVGLVFWRTPRCEALHLTILTFFSLWFVYHRLYDAVICVIPAAVFVDLIVRDKIRKLGVIGVAALGLLAVSIPGLLTKRLHISSSSLAANPAGFVGLHFERFLVFGMFCLLLTYLWKLRPRNREGPGAVIDCY
jgi:hypothetical protein